MPILTDVICTNCPMGCKITLTIDNNSDEILSIEGNKCKQGKEYAVNEYKNPVRVLTATVRTTSLRQPVLPVKTSNPITKDKMKDIMDLTAKIIIDKPVKMGQSIKTNILGIGVDLVATEDLLSFDRN